VILRGDEIVAAGCILPLSRNERLAYTLGTRHRAALGISEESDAFVIVVSEENRQISVAEEGHLRRRLTAEDLRAELVKIYGRSEDLGSLQASVPAAPASSGASASSAARAERAERGPVGKELPPDADR
jgi:hypothetical protein